MAAARMSLREHDQLLQVPQPSARRVATALVAAPARWPRRCPSQPGAGRRQAPSPAAYRGASASRRYLGELRGRLEHPATACRPKRHSADGGYGRLKAYAATTIATTAITPTTIIDATRVATPNTATMTAVTPAETTVDAVAWRTARVVRRAGRGTPRTLTRRPSWDADEVPLIVQSSSNGIRRRPTLHAGANRCNGSRPEDDHAERSLMQCVPSGENRFGD